MTFVSGFVCGVLSVIFFAIAAAKYMGEDIFRDDDD